VKVDIQDVSGVKKKLVVSFPKESVEVELKKELQKIGKKAKIKGFREGKAPFSIVEKVYMPDAMKQYAERVIKESLQKIVEENKIDIAVRPVIEKEDFNDGCFEYHAVVETHPVVELRNYKGLTFSSKKIDVTEDEIDGRISEMKSGHVTYEDKAEDEAVDIDDLVNIKVLKYLLDGKDMGTSEREDIDLSKNSIFPEIKEALKGMKPGEEKEINFKYADDIKDDKLKGKPVEFMVKVVSVKKKIQPDNEDLAKKLEYQNYGDMREKTKSELEATKRRDEEERFRQNMFNKLADENPFEVPEGMAEELAMKMLEDFGKNMEKAGVDLGKLELDWKVIFENNKTSAKQTLKRHYLVKAIKDIEKLDVDEAELDAKVEDFIQKSQNNPQVAAYFQQNPAARRNVYMEAIESKSVEFLRANNQVVEE
jgi:trigger factor